MREIKFRAWDKKNKVMLRSVAVSINGKCAVSQEDIFELMQYTGLKDKNGTKIYEGDILKRKNDGAGFKIIFDYKCACFAGKYFYGIKSLPHSLEIMVKNAIIIGNIYENSNLLNK